jgi:hypothetical protein
MNILYSIVQYKKKNDTVCLGGTIHVRKTLYCTLVVDEISPSAKFGKILRNHLFHILLNIATFL